MTRKVKNNKNNKESSLQKELLNYLKTIFISFCVGAVFSIFLSLHARSEMIKNLYVDKEERSKIEYQVAQQILEHSDITSALASKNYSLCMRVGDLYQAVGDFPKAEYAYNLAIEKVPQGVYKPYYNLAVVLIAQDKIKEAENLIESIDDISNIALIKFKTRCYIVLGDKYYSIGKFLKAADSYERANYYYTRLSKKDKAIVESIKKRLVNAYLEASLIILKNGYNTDAARFLKKALLLDPNNYKIQYRLAIVYSDLDPIVSLDYFEQLMNKYPQEIDYNVYNRALMKAANIEELRGNSIKAKYYRYKVHSLDLFVNNKVIYKDNIEVYIKNFDIKKSFFKYKLIADFRFQNNSASDISKMSADFVLKHNNKIKETITTDIVNKKHPLLSNGNMTDYVTVKFGKNIFTKKELSNYYLEIYLYKDPKFKTYMGQYTIPLDKENTDSELLH